VSFEGASCSASSTAPGETKCRADRRLDSWLEKLDDFADYQSHYRLRLFGEVADSADHFAGRPGERQRPAAPLILYAARATEVRADASTCCAVKRLRQRLPRFVRIVLS
jgi:hypothetical protein